jgi:hypothetical protein
MPAVKQNRNVVVPMQEDQRFLVNDNEKCVEEFTVHGSVRWLDVIFECYIDDFVRTGIYSE